MRSTVPTLILQGAYDTRTPINMGLRASRELGNSRLVIVPQRLSFFATAWPWAQND